MASSRREYFRRTEHRMRDLKNSPTGILSFCTAMAALAVFLYRGDPVVSGIGVWI